MTSIIDGFFDDLIGNVVSISNLMPRLKNIDYNSSTNTTTVYGHTNFEELKVNNVNVALQNHTHVLNDVAELYEEEEQYVEEEDDGEGNVTNVTKTRTVTKSRPLTDLLSNKSASVHTHTTADLTNWATATSNFAKTNAANTFTTNQQITNELAIVGGSNATFMSVKIMVILLIVVKLLMFIMILMEIVK